MDANGNVIAALAATLDVGGPVKVDGVLPVVSLAAGETVQDTAATKSKTWNWECSKSDCEYRHAVTQSNTHTWTVEEYGDITTATQDSGDGTYYLHVEAKDGRGNKSAPFFASALLDNTGPQLLSVDIPPAGHYGIGDRLTFTAHFNEPVEVYHSDPDFAQDDNLNAYLSIRSGQAYYKPLLSTDEKTLVFTHDIVIGLPEDTLVWGNIIVNQTKIQDLAGNSTTGQLGTGSNNAAEVKIDGVLPLVTNLVDDEAPKKSKTWTWGCSESNCKYRHVITQSDSHTWTSETYNDEVSATQALGDGTYYVHVQAKDQADNESVPDGSKAMGVLDNTAPVVSRVEVPVDNTYGLGSDLTFKVHFNEKIASVQGSPLMRVTIGSTGEMRTMFRERERRF